MGDDGEGWGEQVEGRRKGNWCLLHIQVTYLRGGWVESRTHVGLGKESRREYLKLRNCGRFPSQNVDREETRAHI